MIPLIRFPWMVPSCAGQPGGRPTADKRISKINPTAPAIGRLSDPWPQPRAGWRRESGQWRAMVIDADGEWPLHRIIT